ncbi:MAG: GFA family protein [Paracoccaceae bacterium]|jgi:hypothetical protein
MECTAVCHCGAVELKVLFPDGLVDLKRCNCSICRRKGAVMAYTSKENLEVLKGSDKLSTYSFHTHAAQHYFCSVCGIYTHHVPRINPAMFGINVGCIVGVDMDALGEIPVNDGVNHPMDKKT